MEQDITRASDVTIENLLKHLANSKAKGCLQVSCDTFSSVSFFLYFWEGKLYYATNSLAPFERLERHLRRLSNQNSHLSNRVIKEVRQKVNNSVDAYIENPSDYQGILWLASGKTELQPTEIITLLRRLVREVIESLLCLPEPLIYKFVKQPHPLTELCSFDVNSYIDQCQKRIQAWQIFTTHVQSTYERLYLASEGTNNIPNLTAEQNQTLCKLLKGLNFRQISALIDKDELIVARLLYPAIIDGSVIIRSPKQPFDKLPDLPVENLFENITAEPEDWSITGGESKQNADGKETIQIIDKQWRIACIDDSTAIQEKIQKILEHNMFLVAKITKPMNALAELMEFKPQVIFLDIDMPQISGYELCSLLRNHHEFKTTPIVMLTGERGLVNLTKSKLVGATDYLVKPFNQSSLFNVLFKYIN
ncbi:Response regulator containing a CheY-like receiver domain and a GGDEF domain [Hyella patelloides LEGE 07179]|uniref:Response regulator containing a CheY-like receiver domain and a GGDEF domain n=1 Tax=Hyella patelloides LEGE 07179 TaxID=945734 RepID=A0A563W3D0_9CYAN|nr:response regulator [Hyella patelloides]VEP18201.1 Response regulator containing a CheY-like receiver domain and a GGDEF domain [Hyella patelloides LEGE 07179]